MTALGLLGAIRQANLHDDEARILLAVAAGFRRFTDVGEKAKLKETQLRKMLDGLCVQGLLSVEKAPRGATGRGKCSVYSLTGAGIGKVREIYTPVSDDKTARPVPVGVALALPVKSDGLCFLQQ